MLHWESVHVRSHLDLWQLVVVAFTARRRCFESSSAEQPATAGSRYARGGCTHFAFTDGSKVGADASSDGEAHVACGVFEGVDRGLLQAGEGQTSYRGAGSVR